MKKYTIKKNTGNGKKYVIKKNMMKPRKPGRKKYA